MNKQPQRMLNEQQTDGCSLKAICFSSQTGAVIVLKFCTLMAVGCGSAPNRCSAVVCDGLTRTRIVSGSGTVQSEKLFGKPTQGVERHRTPPDWGSREQVFVRGVEGQGNATCVSAFRSSLA